MVECKLEPNVYEENWSQAAYGALGCSFAEEINEELAAAEPFDVQMEYRLQIGIPADMIFEKVRS